MKLISMHVDNFGSLHNYTYNFDEGLNVVLQDNGWGKTTMAAFLKAMLYGYDTKRSKDITENERKRYLPWQGGTYGGTLDFEADGVSYRILRTFGETPRFDTARIINLDTKTTARIPADKIGESFFHLDASAFQRSVFINQNGLSIDGAASSIHTRLNTLVSQANDVAAYDGAITNLTQQIKVYEKTGARGELGNINRKIDEKERVRDNQEQIILKQDAARERISEIDVLLRSINQDLETKTKKLDEVSGEEKKREASAKLLADVDKQIAELQKKIDGIKTDLGGTIPTIEEIDRVKRQVQNAASLKQQIDEQKATCSQLMQTYNALLEKYGGTFPSSEKLDEIQSVYGELQGVLSAAETETAQKDVPEGYTLISRAAEKDPAYVSRLQQTVELQIPFQNLIRRRDAQNRDLKVDTESWTNKTKRYSALRKEEDRLQRVVQEQEAYRPDAVDPVIAKLEDLQKRQERVAVKTESFSSAALTREQETFLQENPGDLPDETEGKEIIKKCREVSQEQAAIDSLSVRLDGENSRVDSIADSLSQLQTIGNVEGAAPKKPQKSSGTIMLGAGAVLTVLGIALGIATGPVLFSLAVVGVILVVLGVVGNSNYRKQIQAYETWQNKTKQNQAVLQQKNLLYTQYKSAMESVSELGSQLADYKQKLSADQAVVATWFAKWAPYETDYSEAAVSRILDKADSVKRLRKVQAETAASGSIIETETQAIEADLAGIIKFYPACAGHSIPETLSFLRDKESAYKVISGQLAAAVQARKSFVEENGVSDKELETADSPNKAKLTAARDTTAAELEELIEKANQELQILDLDTDEEHLARALKEAEEMLGEYKHYAESLKEKTARQGRKQQQTEDLQGKLTLLLMPLGGQYSDREIPERLALIREELNLAKQTENKLAETEGAIKRSSDELISAEQKVAAFKSAYGHFVSKAEDDLPEIYEKAGQYRENIAAKQQLEKQKESVGREQALSNDKANAQVLTLQNEINALKETRDNLLIEYTQKADFIRQADQSLEQYPDTVQEIRTLYEQKQKAQNRLSMLKRAIALITKAKENLANRYLSKVEDRFNSYMHIWLNNEAVRGILDIDFNITIEEDEKVHVAEGYSTGYCDMIDFCMRLALIDTLFENEQPFLILDDPFVNLDAERLEKALELLGVMAANKQIIYFVCHPIRAVETEENSSSRQEFLKLAAATRKAIGERQVSTATQKKITKKSPKELYKVIGSSTGIPFRPANPNYIITNSIFSLTFVPVGIDPLIDGSYELFFIDAVGHVLNDRQLIEVSNGKLSVDRIQFSLNTREDSGNEFELMVRERGQQDYEVSARIPFRARIAFTGTFSFDF